MKLKNDTFRPYLCTIANDILDIELDSGRYFVKHYLEDFGLPIEDYGDRVSTFIREYDI